MRKVIRLSCWLTWICALMGSWVPGMVWGQVTADFNVSTQAGCSPLTVQFVPQTTGAVTAYMWDFGNGNTSTLPAPSVIYLNPGSYTISLIVSDGVQQDTMEKVNFITVFADPQAQFTANPMAGCAPLNVQFADQTVLGDAPIQSYTWDFGDGSIANTASASHDYLASGTYDVTLVVVDTNGCRGTLLEPDLINVSNTPVADFTWQAPGGCQSPLAVNFTSNVNPAGSYTYLWDFGDGNTSTQENPSHSYLNTGTYTVSLIVSDPNGCADTMTQVDAIQFEFPQANFALGSNNLCVGEPVSLTNLSVGGTVYVWNFGDGNSFTGPNPMYAYTQAGTFTPSLIAINSLGCADTFQSPQTLTVSPTPTGALSVDAPTGCQVPHIANFSAATTNTQTYAWDFGDGGTANVQNPSHVYNQIGIYDVSLMMESADGCRDTVVQPAFIQLVPPEAAFAPDTASGCLPLGVNFNDLSVTQFDSLTDWIWDFGDGSGSFDQEPSHTYTTVGQFTVSLIVSTLTGCRDTFAYNFIEGGNKPNTQFDLTPTSACAGDPVSFIDQSTSADEWEWDFGDGSGSDLQFPTHNYGDTGSFTVTLISRQFGCADTLVRPDCIFVRGPIAEFTLNPTQGCDTPLTVTFTDASILATNWVWDFGDGTQDTVQNPTHTYTQTGTYTIRLTVSNDTSSCVDDFEYELTIASPIANFVQSDTLACTGVPINFTNNSIDAIGYLWDFGNGDTSNATNPSHVFRTPGTYLVRLIAFGVGGCTDTMISQLPIRIIGPQAVFQADSLTGCAPLTVQFTENSFAAPVGNVITGWVWDFGDGSSANGPNPVHTYNQAGDYDVRLVVVDNLGCSDTLTRQAYIQPTFPTASFTTLDTLTCPGAPVQFINQSTGVGNTYLWNFGDGTTSSVQDPIHIYPPNTGSYNVVLTVTDVNGCVSQVTANSLIEVGPPVANFFASPTQQACPPLAVSFLNQSTGNITDWDWDFGDGTTSTLANPSKVYSLPGTFDVTLRVETAQGCRDTIFRPGLIDLSGPGGSFSVTPLSGCTPLEVEFTANTSNAVQWTWDFGDGNLGLGQTVTHTYTDDTTAFPVLVIRDTAGCTVAIPATDSITILAGPNPTFIVSDSAACLGQPLNFFNTTFSSVPIVSYFWDFGDGDTANVANPTHLYGQPGNYAVQLTLTNQNGCTDSTRIPLNISVNPPPVAQITPSQLVGCAPMTVTFIDSTQFGSGPVAYFWDFGDGNVATQKSPTHTFNNPGSYRVRMLFSDGNGCEDSTSVVITVQPGPTADLSVSATDGCAPKTIQFTDQSTSVVPIVAWFWEFGDGDTSAVQFPQHTYETNGTFDVSLTVRDANGCTDTRLYPDLISLDAPLADFTTNVGTACPPSPVSFASQATADTTITDWLWLFGDGQTDTVPSPNHVYQLPGSYEVTLIVTDAKGCRDTLVRPNEITLLPIPTAGFGLSDSQACAPLTIQLSDSSQAANVPITNYTYTVSNGSQANLPNPSFFLADSGTYVISQIVQDANGCRDTMSQSVTLFPGIATQFTASDSSGCTSTNLTFVDQSTGGNGAVTWRWDFGDGTTDTVKFPSHTYGQIGTYDVSLRVENSYGCVDSLEKPQWITIDGPLADFTPDSAQTCQGTSLTFNDQTTSPQPIVQYDWDFGDGNQGNGPSVTHTYAIPGVYTISLTVTDAQGCQQTTTKNNAVRVWEGPTALATLSDTAGCDPFLTQYTDQSQAGDAQIVQYAWDFGNGTGSVFPTGTQAMVGAGLYGVSLEVTDANGCRDTIANSVQVYGNPTASYVTDLQSGCAPRPIQFLSQSVGPANIVNWDWNFGDGNIGTGNLFTHTYANDGIYDVSLAIADINGCVDTVRAPQSIRIAPPEVTIGISDAMICPGGILTFFDQSQPDTPFVAWQWVVGNGDSLSGQQVDYSYNQAGDYTIELIATDALGCVGRDTFVNGVEVLNPPIAAMVLSDTSGCPPFTVQAADASSGDRPIVGWDWQLSNGDQGNFINISSTLSQPGSYDIQLVSTDQFGCQDTVAESVEVFGPPIANFLTSKTLGCVGETIDFIDVSQGNANIDTWIWDFGDGTTSFLGAPNHVYTQSGLYTVSLIVFDERGCTDTLTQPNLIRITQPTADFSVIGQPACPGTTIRFVDGSQADTLLTGWRWDFGDGNGGTTPNPDHLYTQPGIYDVSLIVTNLIGCTDTLTQPQAVEIFAPPVAGFQSNGPGGCIPFVFTAQDTSLTDVQINQWQWFQAGQLVGNGPNFQATLNQVGTTDFSLVVVDSRGCTDSTDQPIEVFPLPVADFVASDTSGCEGMVVRFSDLTPGNMVAWNWDFGDGGTDSVAQPIHSYTMDGRFDVSLRVVDQNGCTDDITKAQHIEISRPTGDFEVSYVPDCPPVEVTFRGLGSSPRGVASIAWDFGDGNQAIGAEVQHTYVDTGAYDITLLVTDSLGCVFSLTKPAEVEIFGADRPSEINVHAVSVENQETVRIRWAPDLSIDFGAYVIYWQDGGGNWTTIHTATGQLDTLFVDSRPGILNTEASAYCYRVVSRNACGIEGSLNLAETHCTNEVTAEALPNRVVLTWTGYEGWNQVAQYEIYRAESYDPQDATFLDVVPGNTRTYVDTATRCFNSYTYRIRALGQAVTEVSWSDTTQAMNQKAAPQQSTLLLRATVEDNQQVLVEWERFRLDDLIEVHLEKSDDDGANWQGITTLDPSATAYTDTEVDVSMNSYTYRLWGRDSCGFVSPYSNLGKTILLSGEDAGLGRQLTWTAYEEWTEGVDFYEIQVFSEGSNQFIRVDLVDGSTTTYEDATSFLNQGSYCYRIIAYEKGGNLAQSISNEVCLGIDPALYVPNAFTPNGDFINDTYTIRGVYIQSAQVQIFNRWGRKVYEAQQLEPGWDGRYEGELVPEGVYVVVVDAIANDGRKISKRGTITVYR